MAAGPVGEVRTAGSATAHRPPVGPARAAAGRERDAVAQAPAGAGGRDLTDSPPPREKSGRRWIRWPLAQPGTDPLPLTRLSSRLGPLRRDLDRKVESRRPRTDSSRLGRRRSGRLEVEPAVFGSSVDPGEHHGPRQCPPGNHLVGDQPAGNRTLEHRCAHRAAGDDSGHIPRSRFPSGSAAHLARRQPLQGRPVLSGRRPQCDYDGVRRGHHLRGRHRAGSVGQRLRLTDPARVVAQPGGRAPWNVPPSATSRVRWIGLAFPRRGPGRARRAAGCRSAPARRCRVARS